MIYVSKDGETLDFICWLYYGRTAGVVEKVLLVNRHLAELENEGLIKITRFQYGQGDADLTSVGDMRIQVFFPSPDRPGSNPESGVTMTPAPLSPAEANRIRLEEFLSQYKTTNKNPQ